MLEKIIVGTIQYKRVVVFTAIAAVLLGVYSYDRAPKQEFPEVITPIAMIQTAYPGASPQEVEQLVTNKNEELLPRIPGYASLQSYSTNSLSVVIAWLDIDADVGKAWEKLRYDLAALQSTLPESCQEIGVNTELNRTTGFIYSLSGMRYSNNDLLGYGEGLKTALLKTEGVIGVDILGQDKQEIVVNVDIDQLAVLTLLVIPTAYTFLEKEKPKC